MTDEEVKPDRPEGEFDGIGTYSSHKRELMSKPLTLEATNKLIREVMDVTGITDLGKATEVADWLLNKMERYGARTAQLMFDVDGAGPLCSWCGEIWPLCGHHHMSEIENILRQHGETSA